MGRGKIERQIINLSSHSDIEFHKLYKTWWHTSLIGFFITNLSLVIIPEIDISFRTTLCVPLLTTSQVSQVKSIKGNTSDRWMFPSEHQCNSRPTKNDYCHIH